MQTVVFYAIARIRVVTLFGFLMTNAFPEEVILKLFLIQFIL